MQPIINPFYFYLISVGAGFKAFLFVLGGVSLLAALIIFAIKLDDYSYSGEDAISYFKIPTKVLIISIIMFFIGCLIPSETTCYKMMAASLITYDNIESVSNSATEVIDYIVESTNKIQEQKEKD